MKDELEKDGLKFSYWVNHEETYKVKKYKRRLQMLSELKRVYGEDYDPYWDLEGNLGTSFKPTFKDLSMCIKDIVEQLLDTLLEIDPSIRVHKEKLRKLSGTDLNNIDLQLLRKMVKYYINFLQEGGTRLSSNKHKAFLSTIQDALSTEKIERVSVEIPKGSFYAKFMKDKWRKPKTAEEIFSSATFKFKYGDSYPQPSNEEFPQLPQYSDKRHSLNENTGLEGLETENTEDPGSPSTSKTSLSTDRKLSEKKSSMISVEQKSSESIKQEDAGIMEINAESTDRDEKIDTNQTKSHDELVAGEKPGTLEKRTSVRFESEEDEDKEPSESHEDQEKERKRDVVKGQDDEVEDVDEGLQKKLDVRSLFEIIEEKKQTGEEIINLEDLSSYESIESMISISSMADSPDDSICSEDWHEEKAEFTEETERDLKEYFEGPPPRYEPPRRRPYCWALEEDGPTEEWVSEEKKSSEELTKSLIGFKKD